MRCMQNIALAVQALHALKTQQPWAGNAVLARTQLVLAGGYDERLAENKDYFRELLELIKSLGLGRQVCPVCLALLAAPRIMWGLAG